MINVTKTFLPDFDAYIKTLKRAWDTTWITNNGELVRELEQKLKEYLGVKYLLFTNNGTVVLQMALKIFGISGEVITTPFSYVATTNAILWEQAKPVFIDIEPGTLCIDADKIEAAITERTQAILATHVYGYPCAVDKLQNIANRYGLKLIYDGAHAFGASYKGKSLLSYGDISTCSFHATKIFHTVEGGCIICHDEETYNKLFLFRSFGHIIDDYQSIGINGKNSEFHAAMGLSVLPHIPEIISSRRQTTNMYLNQLMHADVELVGCNIPDLVYNYAYFPVLFKTEQTLLRVKKALEEKMVNTRRYFYPSLNTLPFLESSQPCVISENISERVLCLPLYYGLEAKDVTLICETIIDNLN